MPRSAASNPRHSAPYLNYKPPVLTGRDNSVYAYGGVLYSRKSANNAILQKSVDFGDNWTDVHTFDNNVGIVVVCANGNILVGQKTDSSFFTDPPAELHLSTDNGASFAESLTLASGGFESFSYDVYQDTVFVGEYGKYNSLCVYRSIDGGSSWQTVFTHPVDGSATVHIHKVHIDKVTPSTIYISAGDGAAAQGVWCSVDNGDNWSAITRSHQPTWIETDASYVYFGEDLEGKIHRIAKSRFADGETAVEAVYDAQTDGRGSFGNLSFYSGATDNYGNIYFGGVAYGMDSVQNNTKDAALVVSHDQGKTWALIQSFLRQRSVSSGFSVMSKVQSNDIIYVRTSNSSTVQKLDTGHVNDLLVAGLGRLTSTRPVFGNVAPNGDFSLYPSGSTATTGTATRWVDGTAGGSQAKASVYAWAIPTGGYAGTAEALFDSTVVYSTDARSMKLSNTNATGAITVATFRNATPNEYFTLLPSTTYTLTVRLKTNNAPTNGAYVDVREFTETGSTVITRSTTKLAGTNNWTLLTLNFTTGSTTRLGAILLRLNVAGNVCDAWYARLTLVPNVGRSTA